MTPLAASLRRPWLFGSCLLALALSGCGIGTTTTSSRTSFVLNGSVHGGIQAISGSTIQLYAAGSAGNGSASIPLLASPVVTNAQGTFTITGDYTCPSASTQVYLVARGGNPGFSFNVNNPALVLVSALGNCGNLAANASQSLAVNEVTTVAAAYALAQFTSAYDHLGATATNGTGMTNAFLDAQLLANPYTGLAAQLPSNLAIETGKLYALADALVPCVNSDGGGCTALFAAATPTGGSAPTDSLGAALDIVRNPGHNVGAIFSAISSTPPYPTTLTAAPSDWSMSLSVTGGGLVEPTQLAIDGLGNVWVANYGDPDSATGAASAGLVAFSPQGTALSGSPFGAGLQTEAYGLTLDRNGDIWVTSAQNTGSANSTGSLAKFHGASSSTPGALVGQFSGGTLNWPESVASDPSGNGTVLVGNYVGGTVSVFDLNGNFLRDFGNKVPSFPVAVTSDNAGGAWVGDQGDYNIVHIRADGSTQAVSCCSGAQAVVLDKHANVWATNYFPVGRNSAFTFSEVSPAGSVLLGLQGGGGLNSPGGAAIDAGGQFWVANYDGADGTPYGTLSEFAGSDTAVAAGTALSPASGLGLDAGMSRAYAVAPDASGNLWVSVRNGNSLRMFFGLATPTATPAAPLPQAP